MTVVKHLTALCAKAMGREAGPESEPLKGGPERQCDCCVDHRDLKLRKWLVLPIAHLRRSMPFPLSEDTHLAQAASIICMRFGQR